MATNYDTGEIVDLDETSYSDGGETFSVTRALAPREAYQHSREEIEALKDTIKATNRTMTDAQFVVFMAAARRLGLDPLARQIVPVFQGERMTVQTTIDGFRLIAERTRKYRGQIGPFWCGPDGEWKDVWLADGAPTAAKVGVRRSDFDEIMWGVARTKSYAKGGNWVSMPDVMIAKVAESLALRKAFPAELSGAYTAEEIGVVDADPLPTPMPAITAPSRPAPATPPTSRPATPTTTPAAPAPTSEDERVAPALRNRTVLDYLTQLGITDQTKRKAHLAVLLDTLDAELERKATGRDLMDALEAQVASKRDKAGQPANSGGNGGNGDPIPYDLRDLPVGAPAN